MKWKMRIPATLDLDYLIQVKPLPAGCKRDKIVYILDFMWWRLLKNKAENEDSCCVCINAKNLQLKIGSYQTYLEYLIRNKVIEKVLDPVVGEHSTGYCFTDTYASAENAKYVTITDNVLIRKIKSKNKLDRPLPNTNLGLKRPIRRKWKLTPSERLDLYDDLDDSKYWSKSLGKLW